MYNLHDYQDNKTICWHQLLSCCWMDGSAENRAGESDQPSFSSRYESQACSFMFISALDWYRGLFMGARIIDTLLLQTHIIICEILPAKILIAKSEKRELFASS